jgi:hypothetical protein
MTSSGRRWAFLIGIVIAFMLPKRVECGYPDAHCEYTAGKELCVTYELEPLGFSLIEMLVHRNVGFAYKSGELCGADRF